MKQTLTVFSPAKVNLQLEIGERRTDGFHQAKSIMQALTLHDMVTVVLDDGVDAYLNPNGFSDFAIDVTCTTFEGIPELDVAPESNIAYKAAAALAEKGVPMTVAALRNPYDLPLMPENAALLAAFDYSRDSLAALADVFSGGACCGVMPAAL